MLERDIRGIGFDLSLEKRADHQTKKGEGPSYTRKIAYPRHRAESVCCVQTKGYCYCKRGR